MKKLNRGYLVSLVLLIIHGQGFVRGEEPYLEPGALRLSHEITLEGLLHRVTPDWKVQNIGINKNFSKQTGGGGTWETEWGQSLLTEAAARVTRDLFGRVLFEGQGDYADRFWRPNNIGHHLDDQDRHLLLREAEGRIERTDWHAHAFSGASHGDWRAEGDFFGLYPGSYPDDSYLRHSGYFGVYPERFKQNLFLNISKRRVPQGFEVGAQFYGLDGAVAYGDELSWGYAKSAYGRAGIPLRSSKLTFVYKDEDVPYSFDQDSDERNRAYALSWAYPADDRRWLDVGVLYQPFRVGDPYKVARAADGGSGLLGSNFSISEKTTKKEDGLAGRLRVNRHLWMGNRDYRWHVDLTRAGVIAGNKEQADVGLGTDLFPSLQGRIQYIYRRPIEGPVPFLYEGTVNNLGAVAANPRGPESPFTVDWQNREAGFLLSTLVFDPTPSTGLFLFDPNALQIWNINPNENAPFAMAFQFRLTDYKTTTDRQYYYDENGDILWEPAAHSGAWPTGHPLPEFRFLAHGRTSLSAWTFGFAGGEAPALSGLAYSNDTRVNKPITDYYSFEGRLDRWPWALWGHYGYGIWGPEPYQHFLGESFDRLWGVGLSYNITVNTTVDLSYLSARQDDTLFVSPNLGTYDEIRTLFSHRFGFLFQFRESARPGFKAR